MSWVARSLASSLRLDEDDADADDDEECDVAPNQPHDSPSTSPKDHEYHHSQHQQQQQQQPQFNELGSENEPLRGVQEDLNVFKQTLTRQFWGMASFLAPPPTDSHSSFPSDGQTQSDPLASTCNRSDPSDQCVSGNGEESEAQRIGGDSSDIEYASFGREASGTKGTNRTLIPFGSESVGYEESEMEEDIFERAVGITDEVLAFARNISMHPETWLDFPIDEEEDTSGKRALLSHISFE